MNDGNAPAGVPPAGLKLDLTHVLWVGGAGFLGLGLFLLGRFTITDHPLWLLIALSLFALALIVFNFWLHFPARAAVASVCISVTIVLVGSGMIMSAQRIVGPFWYFTDPFIVEPGEFDIDLEETADAPMEVAPEDADTLGLSAEDAVVPDFECTILTNNRAPPDLFDFSCSYWPADDEDPYDAPYVLCSSPQIEESRSMYCAPTETGVGPEEYAFEEPIIIVEEDPGLFDPGEVSVVPEWKERFLRSAALPALVALVGGVVLLVFRRFLPAWVLIGIGAWIALLEIVRLAGIWDIGFRDISMRVNIRYGFGLLFLAYFMDLHARMNHGFWVSKLGWIIFGTGMGQYYLRFYGDPDDGLSGLAWLLNADWSQEVFLLTCLGATAVSVFVRRPGGLPFATLGVFTYFFDHFRDLFPNDLVGAMVMALLGGSAVLIATLLNTPWQGRLQLWRDRFEPLRPDKRDDPVTFGF